jgi:hypothetical protein
MDMGEPLGQCAAPTLRLNGERYTYVNKLLKDASIERRIFELYRT